MSKENKITLKDGTTIKVTGGGKKDSVSVSIYQGDYRDKDNHSATHININGQTGKGSIVEHGTKHSNPQKTDTQCYLTTACMQHFQDEFDENCYELTVLRWFRDNFVAKEDITLYYEVAPIIVENIEILGENDKIYEYIYNHIVEPCVNAIENGDYDFAYNRYKSSVLTLNEQFGETVKEQEIGFVKKLGTINYKSALAYS